MYNHASTATMQSMYSPAATGHPLPGSLVSLVRPLSLVPPWRPSSEEERGASGFAHAAPAAMLPLLLIAAIMIVLTAAAAIAVCIPTGRGEIGDGMAVCGVVLRAVLFDLVCRAWYRLMMAMAAAMKAGRMDGWAGGWVDGWVVSKSE